MSVLYFSSPLVRSISLHGVFAYMYFIVSNSRVYPGE